MKTFNVAQTFGEDDSSVYSVVIAIVSRIVIGGGGC